MAYAYFLRPDKMLTFQVSTLGALVPATVTGTVDSDYQANWLCDGRGHFPYKSPTGDAALSIAGFSQSCGLAVLHSHTLDADVDAVLSGDLSAVLADRGGNRPNRIPWNRWISFEPVTADSVVLTIEYNTRDVFIGELLIGERFTIDPPQPGIPHDLPTFALPLDAEFAAGNGYDKGLAGGRMLEFSQAYTRAEMDAVADGLRAWEEACRNGTLPTAFVPNNERDDVIVGTLTGFGWEDQDGWQVLTIRMQEYTRQRWN